MDALFCCRNCIHNCGQSPNVGNGVGYCLQHDSMISDPDDTTCKYLHRKDLPRFVVEEGIEEHAAEFVRFPGLASLSRREPIQKSWYSERAGWEHREFDPIVLLSSQYHRTDRAWVFIQAMSSGIDGRRSLAHASLVRRYMNQCGTWTSSYRLVLAVIQELASRPQFLPADLHVTNGDDADEVARDALWDVVFARLATIQEYGWHSGQEELLWASDHLNGALTSLNWDKLQPELARRRTTWTDLVIEHAKAQHEFFPRADDPDASPAA